MLYKTITLVACCAILTACGSTRDRPSFDEQEQAFKEQRAQIIAKAPHPNFVGQPEWYEWVSQSTGVIDAEGHGPDPGSTEWCHAVHRKVTGFYPDLTTLCDKNWERRIDQILRNDRGWFGIW